MYQGKYSKTSRYSKKRTNKRKAAVLLTSLVLVLVCFVGTTVAYLLASTGTVTNTFNPAQVSCRVDEKSFDGTTKENVTIANTSNIEAYIRAAIIVTWKNAEDGNVYGKMPGEEDYTISLNGTDWFLGSDGYYYHKKPVLPESQNGRTEILIYSCSPVDGKTPEGYGLSVEILGSAIQSVPASVVEQSWKVVKVNTDGTLAKK